MLQTHDELISVHFDGRLYKAIMAQVLMVWLGLLSCGDLGCLASTPSVLDPTEAETLVKKLPSYARFSFSGVAFYNDYLYASSGLGLLEYEDNKLKRVYRWNQFDSDVEGPWFDSANRLLWVWLPGQGQVAHYDGKKWSTMRTPEPKGGLSRGNELEGFRGSCNSQTFWLEGAWHAWAWEAKKSSWTVEHNPPVVAKVGRQPVLRRLLPTDEHVYFVMARDVELMYSLSEVQQQLKGEVICYSDSKWNEVTNSDRFVFFAEETVSTGRTGYVRTRRGDILEVKNGSMQKLSTPGNCEAVAINSSKSLLACFHNLGVYEFGKNWELRFQTPYSATEGEHWVHLAQSDRKIAISVSPVPRLVGGQTVYDSPAALWIFDGQKLQKASFPEN